MGPQRVDGTVLTWGEIKRQRKRIKELGVNEFIDTFSRQKSLVAEAFRWGDEVEYMLVSLDRENKRATLVLKASQVLDRLQGSGNGSSKWMCEYSKYMVESIPGCPYGSLLSDLNQVEENMKLSVCIDKFLLNTVGANPVAELTLPTISNFSLLKWRQIKNVLNEDEFPLCICSFPRNGCPAFTSPPFSPRPLDTSGISQSVFFPDEAVSSHPRYVSLTRNIRLRRQEKVTANIPIFKDQNTISPFVEDFSSLGDNGEAQRRALPDHIYMDATGMGFGCCSIQATFQTVNIDDAKLLYDQLASISPIMLALSAAAPIFRGYLADEDCRWTLISEVVDERTRRERGLELLRNGDFLIKKTRWNSIDCYLSPQGRCYNDLDTEYNTEFYQKLLRGGVDELLAQHVAHMLVRDPLYLFTGRTNQSESEMDHYETFQYTDWKTVRLKLPPSDSDNGWQVEFRPMDVQVTSLENAAYIVFMNLITRVILTDKRNFLIPISKVDENMKTAVKRDAVRKEKFHFRKNVVSAETERDHRHHRQDRQEPGEEYTLMTIDEVINGKEDFQGLISLINEYVESVGCDVDTKDKIQQYLQLISKRASGELLTTAQWIRHFVTSHPDYKQDSVVPDLITYDLMSQCVQIARREAFCPE